MKRSRERSTFWINQVEAISSMCREMDGSPCNIKSAVSGNASGATPFIAPAPSTTRPLALLSRWHFKAPTQTWKAWLPAWSQHNPPPTPFLKSACYPRWARSTPRIHTACHSGTLVKICFVSLINNTPFLLQTQGGRECPSGVHWHCSLWSLHSDKETCWKWRRCYLLHQYLLEFRECVLLHLWSCIVSVFLTFFIFVFTQDAHHREERAFENVQGGAFNLRAEKCSKRR